MAVDHNKYCGIEQARGKEPVSNLFIGSSQFLEYQVHGNTPDLLDNVSGCLLNSSLIR